jgi:hypothetical protein
MTGFIRVTGYGRISTLERCLACEADGEQGDIVKHVLPLSTFYVESLADSRQPLASRFAPAHHQPCSPSASQARQRSRVAIPFGKLSS